MIAVLTKADILELCAIGQLRNEQGLTMKEAKPKAPGVASQMLIKLRGEVEKELNSSKYPPKAYVAMSSRSSIRIGCYNYVDIIMIMQI